MPTDNELDDLFLSHSPQIRKAAIRNVLNELIALGLAEVRTDEQWPAALLRHRVGAGLHFPNDVGGPQ